MVATVARIAWLLNSLKGLLDRSEAAEPADGNLKIFDLLQLPRGSHSFPCICCLELETVLELVQPIV